MKFQISNFKFQSANSGNHSSFVIRHSSFRLGFTLIEIMIVVAIMGLIAAMGLPALMKALQKEGMRKALGDVTDVCASARARAILQNETVAVTFRPADRAFSVEGGGARGGALLVSSSTLPDGVEFAMLDINQQDFSASEWGKVRFFPNGTSDELTVVLHDRDNWHKITLEFSTGMATVSDVDR